MTHGRHYTGALGHEGGILQSFFDAGAVIGNKKKHSKTVQVRHHKYSGRRTGSNNRMRALAKHGRVITTPRPVGHAPMVPAGVQANTFLTRANKKRIMPRVQEIPKNTARHKPRRRHRVVRGSVKAIKTPKLGIGEPNPLIDTPQNKKIILGAAAVGVFYYLYTQKA